MTIFSPPPMTPFPQPVEWFCVRDKTMEARNGREGYTLGEIRYGVLDSQRVCYSVEDQDRRLEEGNGKVYGKSAIPTGRYRITIYQFPRGETPASCLTPSRALAECKFMRQTMQKNCLVVSPSELREHLTEYEIANLP